GGDTEGGAGNLRAGAPGRLEGRRGRGQERMAHGQRTRRGCDAAGDGVDWRRSAPAVRPAGRGWRYGLDRGEKDLVSGGAAAQDRGRTHRGGEGRVWPGVFAVTAAAFRAGGSGTTGQGARVQ